MKKNKIYLLAMVMILFFSYLAIGTPRTAWSVDIKITELPADTDPTPDDLVMTVNDPGGSPANRKVTKANFQKILFNSGIASAIPGTCTEPQTYWATDTDVLYICTAVNTWTLFSSGAPTDAHYLTDRAEAGLSAEVNLGALTTGLLKITVGGGVATPSTAVSGTDYEAGGTAILKSVIAAAGDVLVGTGVATPGVITKGANNTIFGVNNSGTEGFIANFSFDDSAALLYNVTDPTKKTRFLLSGITTGTTRVLTIPNYDGVLAYKGTLTNTKWCTSDGLVVNCTENAPSGGSGETYGYQSWSAGGLIPDTCSGLLQQKSTNNQFDYLAFDGATDEYATFQWFPPDNWDRGTILAKFVWAAGAAMTDAHTVIWGLAGYTVRDGDTLTKAITTGEQVISDAYATGNETGPIQKITAKTPAITIDGTHAVGNPVYFRVHRDADTDTSTVDAWLIGVRIQFTKTTETAW